MKSYGGIQEDQPETFNDDVDFDSDSLSDGFRTPRRSFSNSEEWTSFSTPVSEAQRKEGQGYIRHLTILATQDEMPLSRTVDRIIDQFEKYAKRKLLQGQLSSEFLHANNAKKKEREEHAAQSSKVVQKFGEIYGHQARRQIQFLEWHEQRPVRMIEKYERAPYLKAYKFFIKELPDTLHLVRADGAFGGEQSLRDLGFDVE
ncbi:hypothetical protein K3495_g6458 [Podosphaera aphanis]|nr:hypothetical protein K3495_g6458 [Podosphaera aphanis]